MSATVVLLHGLSGCPESWDDVVARVRTPVDIVRTTLLGHGPSETFDERRVASFDDEVVRITRSLASRGVDGAHLCGYSLGARVGLGLLLRYEHLFRSATLISVNPGIDDVERAARASQDDGWARLLETEGIASFAAAWEAQPLFASQARLPEPIREAEHARRLARRPDGLARALRVLGLAAMPDFRPSLPRVRVPVQLMVGELDAKFLGLARTTAPSMLRCSIRVTANAGHNVILERPDAVAAAIDSALAAAARPTTRPDKPR